MDFLYFHPSKIRISPISTVSSLSPPRCHLSSDRCHHATASCHTFFPLSQDELVTSTSSSGNASSRCLPSRAETEALNLHHCRRLPSPDYPTPTLHYYKKIISTLATLPTNQSRLHFATSQSEHHAIGALLTTIVSFHHCLTPIVPLHNDTHNDELADPLLLPEQLIGM
jgi:hypothetical protein